MEKKVKMIVDAILEKKGLNTVVIDLTDVSTFTDYFIITTGISSVQTNAIKENIHRKLRKTYKNVNIEGENAGVWILMDYGDVVVHIFQQEERERYSLESLWADGKVTHVGDEDVS